MAVTILPRLRPLEIFPTEVEGQRVLCLRDPSGMTDRLAFVPPFAAAIILLCDGARSATDVVAEFKTRTGHNVSVSQVEELVEQLDEGLFLDSPRFHAHRESVLEAFRAAPLRPAVHAGQSYPHDPRELSALLTRLGGTHAPERGAALPHVLVAPHIDFPRGGAVYGTAYRPLLDSGDRPDLVVIFGTDHNGVRHPFTLTRKSYDTPLGRLETDVDLVADLARAAGGDLLFADEIHHRTEHSIEFQAVWLRHVYGAAAPPVLPVLCGSLHRSVEQKRSPQKDPGVRDFLDALVRMTKGKRVLVLAGADLGHVGPRFGDEPWAEDGPEVRTLETSDRRCMDAAARGDAEGFFSAIAAEDDRHRICGLAPIYASLALAAAANGAVQPNGRLLDYKQCPADEGPTSWVSIAALTVGTIR